MKRDFQCKKVYKSEYLFTKGGSDTNGGTFHTLDECRDYVQFIISSKWWNSWCNKFGRKRKNVKVIEARPNRGYACADTATGTIEIPRGNLWYYTARVMLHELSHILSAPVCKIVHGPEFCGVYLEMVKRFIGYQGWLDLKDCFDIFEVKWINIHTIIRRLRDVR